jgi:hypothetical protein
MYRLKNKNNLQINLLQKIRGPPQWNQHNNLVMLVLNSYTRDLGSKGEEFSALAPGRSLQRLTTSITLPKHAVHAVPPPAGTLTTVDLTELPSRAVTATFSSSELENLKPL